MKDVLRSNSTDAVMNLKDTLSLEEAGAYKQPEITQDDAALKGASRHHEPVCSPQRLHINSEISRRVLNGDRTHEWLVTDESGGVSIGYGAGGRIMEELAAAYNTSNKAKEF